MQYMLTVTTAGSNSSTRPLIAVHLFFTVWAGHSFVHSGTEK